MQSEWALDFERRAQGLFQKAVDAIPKPLDGKDGRDGVDGIGWDSMRVEHDGRRGFEFIFTKGEDDHSFKFSIPCVIDAGFWREKMFCEKGDGVTFGGSYWIAQEDTETKPEVGNPAWRLGVKKGRDAR
jgi:integrin beta 3